MLNNFVDNHDSKVRKYFQPIDFHYQFLPCGNYGIRQQ
nr:MAG TPA_asm: hypothetical protein [Caudoviricetes sp.]